MRVSIGITVLIVAVAAGFGWHNSRRIAQFQSVRQGLSQEATKLGISSDPGRDTDRRTKRRRPTRTIIAKLSTSDLLALASRFRTFPNNSNHLLLLDSLSILDPAEMEDFLAKLNTDPELDEGMRRSLTQDCLSIFAREHPQAALELSARRPQLIKDWWIRLSLIRTALASLVKTDPAAALAWVRENPGQVSDYDKLPMISAAFSQDPELAFQLVADLKLDRPSMGVEEIVQSAETLERKSATIPGLRQYLASIPDKTIRDNERRDCFRTLSKHMESEGFESASRWIAESKLTPQELDPLFENIAYTSVGGESGRWIEWMRGAFPSVQTDARIAALIHQWVQTDYQTAARWAMTQSNEKDREAVFQTIDKNWPTGDEAAKSIFRREHGIE